MKVFPFYCLFRGIAVEDLWHDNDECEIGLSVPLIDRRRGKDHRYKHCSYCQILNASSPNASGVHPSSNISLRLHSLSFQAGGRCDLSLQKPQGWLRVTWTGYIGAEQALHGGQNYLKQVGPLHCLYLLNDNSALNGPWFNSLEWLRSVWLPQAQLMGLRYVAHVVQADTHSDILSLHTLPTLLKEVELQVFDEVAAAEDWLHSCQLPRLPAAPGPRKTYPSGPGQRS